MKSMRRTLAVKLVVPFLPLVYVCSGAGFHMTNLLPGGDRLTGDGIMIGDGHLIGAGIMIGDCVSQSAIVTGDSDSCMR